MNNAVRYCRICKETDANKFYPLNHKKCKKCSNEYQNKKYLDKKDKGLIVSSIKNRIDYIYIITNPAWPKYIKIGRATNIENRLRSYQTSSPYRDYQISFQIQSNHSHKIERYFADKYRPKETDKYIVNEWYELSVEDAIKEIHSIILQS